MNLLAVIENIADEYGGPANSLPNLLEALRTELAIKSSIYAVTKKNNEKNEFIERFSIPWVRCKKGGFEKVVYSSELRNRVKSDLLEGDIIFSNNLWNYPAFLACQISRKYHVPHIISVRGSLYPWSLDQGKLRKKLAWLFFQKKSMQRASLIHVTCIEELEAVRKLGIRTPIALVPHGINYEDFQNLPSRESALRDLNLTSNKKYVLFMSRLHKKKGLDVLLAVWPDVVRKNPDWCLLLVGPDYSDYSNKVMNLAKENGIEDNIKILGMLKGHKKKCVFSLPEFFVLPSHSENFGVVIGEALAAGLPTITTTGTPWVEINEYGCGKYIDLSEENLLLALNEMINCDEVCKKKMSQAAKALIKNNYSWPTQAVKFGKALDYVLNNNKHPSVVYFEN